MAEQEYNANDRAQFTQSDTPELDSDPSVALPRLSRLEARFQDEYLLSANDEGAEAEDSAPYPADAFYRACERYLRLGIDFAEPEHGEPVTEDLSIRASTISAKGPSYAL